MVNPLSAITDMLSLPYSLGNSPEEPVSSESDMAPTNAGDTNYSTIWCNANQKLCGVVLFIVAPC